MATGPKSPNQQGYLLIANAFGLIILLAGWALDWPVISTSHRASLSRPHYGSGLADLTKFGELQMTPKDLGGPVFTSRDLPGTQASMTIRALLSAADELIC